MVCCANSIHVLSALNVPEIKKCLQDIVVYFFFTEILFSLQERLAINHGSRDLSPEFVTLYKSLVLVSLHRDTGSCDCCVMWSFFVMLVNLVAYTIA